VAEVHSLHGAALPIIEVDEGIVAELERMLILAKDGKLKGLIYGEVDLNGNITYGWEGKADRHCMIAVASLLNYKVLKAAVDG
jgi:hypothetical protein